MKIKQKKAVEAPAQVKHAVQQITSTPLAELASVLRGFKWTFDKGDINHWVPVLDHFDSFFEEYTSKRADVQLRLGEEGVQADPPFPTAACLAVLSATCVLLENCSNKAAYNSSEHLTHLLAAPVPEVVAAALQAFQVLLRKTHHTSVRWTAPPGLSQRLLCLSKGWGGKEEGLDLVVCASSDVSAAKQALQKATTLHFEFSSSEQAAPSTGSSAAAGAHLTSLHVPGLDAFTESEHEILAGLVQRYKVPAASRFELLCRIRIARNFGSLAGRRQRVWQRLMAFNVLLQCSPTAEEYNSLYLAEPDFVSELVALVQCEEAVEEELRTLALRALAAQLHDRSRSSSVITAITSGGQSGLLSMLLHKSIASILQQANVPLVPAGSGVLPADVAAAGSSAAAAAASSPGAVAAAAAPPAGSVQYSVAFVDALLTVVAALVQSTSGCQALNDAGVISALLPLLRGTHADHLPLVCASLKILEAYMDLSQPAATTFRDLGGLTEVIKRTAAEVGVLPGSSGSAASAGGAAADGDVLMAAAEQPAGQAGGEQQQQQQPAAQAPAESAAAPAAAPKQLSHNRKTLLKFLLRTIALSSYAPTGNLAATRPQDEDAQLLYASLKEMYRRPDEFGGSLFSLAVSVMTDLIHHEPQSFRQLQEAGLPDAYLAAIKAGVVPSGDAIVSIPSALVALCLNSTGLRRVREMAVLNVLVDVFTSKKTMRVLTSDTPAILGSGLEELLRFVPTLRSDGVDVVLGVFKALCILGEDAGEIAEASKPLPPEAAAEQEQPAAAAAADAAAAGPSAAPEAAAAGEPAAAAAPDAAPAAPQPMDTDAAGAGAAAEAAAAPAAAVPSEQAAAPEQAAAAAEPAAEGMDVDVPAQPAAAAEPAAAAAEATAAAAPEQQAAPADEAAAAAPAAAAGAPAAGGAPAAAPIAAQLAAQRERELERQRQQQEDARLSVVAKRALAETLQQVVARRTQETDVEVFLPLALTAASRMLEPLLANAETSRLFVERGGADVLLKLYKLPRLTPVFNFSSASHSLLSVFRALSGAHGAAIAAKSKEAVAEQLALLLPQAQQLGGVCVQTLPADVRDRYAKQVLVVQGLVALTSAVARNVTAMLQQVSMGEPPLLASMGKLERIVMAQAAASDPWKQARDVAKKEAAAMPEPGAAAAAGAGAAAVVPAAGAGEAAQAAAGAAGAPAAAAAADNADMDVADDDMDAAAADAPAEGAAAAEAPAAAPAASASASKKRTPEDTSYDALSYLLTSLRTFYMGTAKAIHTPVRRTRDEPATPPTVPMKAAALNLALLLVGNLQLRPWDSPQASPAPAQQEQADAAGAGAGADEQGSSGAKQRLDAAVAAVRGRSGHYLRLAEELAQVLFDSRRHYCHLLVLNYFSALGGMQVLAACFNDAAELLWGLMAAQETAKAAPEPAPATGDQAMVDAQPATSSSAAAGGEEAAAAAAAAGPGAAGTAGTKDPRTVMEAVLVKMLAIYEQLANSTVLLATPQAANMLLAALPNYAGQPLVPPSKDPVQFVQQLHSHILSAVLPLWSHPKAAYAPAGVLTAMIRVLQTCSAGPSHASLVLRYQQQGRPVQRVQPAPDPQMVTTITEMGFSQARAEEALRRVGANSVELAMEWLISHPEEPAAPAAAGGAAAGGAAAAAGGAAAAGAAAPVVDEEEELTRALLASLSVVGMSPDTVAQRSQQQQRQQQQEQEQEQESQPPPAGAADGSPTAAQATSAEEVTTPQATQRPLVQPGAPMPRGAAAAASAASSSHTADSPSSAGTGIPAPAQLVDGAVRLVAASPSTAFSIADLLLTIAQREEGKGREALVGRLMDACLPPAPAADPAAASSSAAAAAVFPPPGGDVLTPARLLLLLLTKDGSSRKVAAKLGLVARSLLQLEQWQVGYRADVEAYERGPAQQGQSADADAAAAVRKLEVPVWVEASLMLLDLMVTTTLRTGSTNPAAAAAARVAAARAAVAAAAEALPRPAAAAAAAPEAAAADAGAAAAPAAAGVDVQMEDQPGAAAPAPAEADAAAAPAAEEASTPQTTPRPVVQPGAPTLGMAPAAAAVGTAVLDTPPPNLAASAAADAAGIKLPAELSQLSGLARVLAGWRPCGLLDDAQQRAATSLCLALLQQLHDHADKWEQPATSMFQADGSLPNPSSVTQALLQLLAHLTKRHSNAQQVLAAGGHRLLLSLPSACLSPAISRHEGSIGSTLRHLLEDPATLEGWMESEIKNIMTMKGGMRDPYTGRAYPYNQANPSSRYTTAASFLSMMSSLVNREPAVFLQAVGRTCTLESSRGETMVRLKTPKEQQQPPQQQQQAAAAAVVSRDASAGGAAGGEQAASEPAAAGAAPAPAAAAAPVTPARAPRTSGTGGGEPGAGAAGSVTPRAGDARDSSAGGAGLKSASKSSRKLVPGSFVEVIDALLDVVLGYQGAPKQQKQQGDAAGSTAMELDTTAAAAIADAGAAAPAAAEQQQPPPASSTAPSAAPAAAASGQDVAPLPADLLLRKLSPLSREVGIQAMVLRLLADYCLLFNNSVGLLLKRDSECGPADVRVSGHHHHHHAAQQAPGHDGRTPARRSSTRAHSSSGGAAGRHSLCGQQQQPDPHKAGVVLKHIMRVQLVEAPPSGSGAGPGVAGNASSLLQAVCIRSGEGRRRIINELVATLTNSSSGTSSRPGSDGGAQQQAAAGVAASKLPYVCKPGSPSPVQVAACVSLMGALVQSGSGPSRSDPRQAQASSMPVEVLRAMREAGAVKALAQALNLVSTEHPQAKDAINAILKPLEVLTRALPKVPAPPAEPAAAPAATPAAAPQQPADTRATPAHASRRAARAAAAATTPAAAAGQQQRAAGAAAATPTGTAAPAAGDAATPAAAAIGSAGGRSSGESGGRAAMDEDTRPPEQHHAGEEAAGPDALAAAGRFVAGGAAGPAAEEVPGQLIDHLMDQLVDIEVELDAGDDDDDDHDDDDSDDDSGSGSEHGSGSDEDMSEGQQHDEEHGDAAGGEGGMGDAPSLTEDSEEDHTGDSDDDGDAGIIMGDAGAAFIDAGAAAAAAGNGPGQLLDDLDSSDEEPDSEEGGHHQHGDAFEDALLAEEEMALMADHMDGHGQEDGVGVDAMDDEEDEYLEEEGSDDEEGWEEEGGEGPLGLDMLEPPLEPAGLDELMPPAMMVPNLGGGWPVLGRLGRRAMYRPASSAAAAAGVWDDMDGGEAGHDALLSGVPMTSVQMLLSQLGINANANSVALMGPNGRQLRLPPMLMQEPQDPATAAAAQGGSEAVNGAITSAMQSLTMQLMPQQHRLLALPPRLPAAESAALLASAGSAAGAAAGTAAAGGAASGEAGLRGQASNVNALTRLLTRAPEAGVAGYVRDGRGRITARTGPGGFMLNPGAVMPPSFGPGANLLQSFEVWQQGALGGGGGGLLIGDSVWDEAVNELLEALAPHQGLGRGLGRVPGAPTMPGQPAGRAGAAAGDDAGLDPRALESHMLALLRTQAPPQQPQPPPPQQQQQQRQHQLQQAIQEAEAAAAAAAGAAPMQAEGAAVAEQAGAAAGDAAAAAEPPAEQPAAAASAPPAPPTGAAVGAPAAGRRVLTEAVFAAAFQAAMSDDPIPAAAPIAPAAEQQPAGQPAQPQQAAGAGGIASHPVDVDASAPGSPTDAAPPAEEAAAAAAADQVAPMDTDGEAAQQQQQQPAEAAGPAAMEAEGAGAAAGEAAPGAAGDALQAAMRQAAEAAGIDLAFLEALPEELRLEVLAAQGVQLRLPQPAAPAPAPPPAAAAAQPAAAAAAEGEAAAAAGTPAADAAAGEAAAAGGDGGAPAAGGVAAAAPAAAAPAPAEDEEPAIDPEFLAALPEDIRQEVLAQQRAEQRARAAAARAAAERGRQAEMGLADLLAAMPDDVRADALTQLNDSDLAQLPPQMRAQAQALRERTMRQVQAQQQAQQAQQAAAQQQQQQHDFLMRRQLAGPGGMLGMPGAGGRLVLPIGPDGMPLPRSFFGGPNMAGPGGYRAGAAGRAELLEAAAARAAAEEPEGPPPLDEADLAVLVTLLRASLPLSKQHLQKLFLNLAGHSTTREQLLRMLLRLLRSLPGTAAGAAGEGDEAAGSQPDAGMDISDDGSQQQQQQGLSAALDAAASLKPGAAAAGGAGDSAAAPSVLAAGFQGKPAIVSRRVLDMLAYLSRHSQPVSRQMLSLRVPDPASEPLAAAASAVDPKGKGKMPAASAAAEASAAEAAPRALEVLLGMLSAPLCQRSVSLLEQLMLLMEVVLTMVQRYESDQRAVAALLEARRKEEEAKQKAQAEQQQQQQAQQEGQQQAGAAAQAEQPQQQVEQQPASSTEQQQQQQQQQAEGAQPAAATAPAQQPGSTPFQQPAAEASKQQDKQQQAPSSIQPPPSELASTLASLQPSVLQQLPGLLARESLSEPAYVSIAKVIKLIVESAPAHLPLMLSMLVEGAAGVAQALLGFLDAAAEKGIDADAQLAPAIGTKSGVVLRMLYALQGFQAEVKEWLKQQEQDKQDASQQQQPAAGPSSSAQAGPSSSRAAAAAGASSRAAAAAGSSSAASRLPTNLDPGLAASEVDKAVGVIAARTSPLWKSLSSCILRVEDNLRAVLPQHMQAAGETAGNAAARLLPPGAQQVLPLVEAFFVLCALQGAIPAPPSQAKDLLSAPSMDASALRVMAPASSSGAAPAAAVVAAGGGSSSQLNRLASASLSLEVPGAGDANCLPFLRFTERHRRLLNAYIRRNTGLLESSLAPLLRVPKLIDFDNKRAYFRSKVRSPDERAYAGTLRLAVKRSSVFEDSFNKLRSKTPQEMRGKLSVAFVGEEGIDAGGVSREWYQVMAREIFNPNLALFVSVPEGGTTFQPNPNSVVQSDTGVSHLEFFKFVGRLVGKALYDGQIMDAYFTRSFYKHMLGQPLTYEDIEAVDPEYYKNLKWMLENDITDVLDLTFAAESDFFGKTEIVELVPGGREVKVTEANKHEYVNLIARHRMTTSIKAQIQAFLEGFWQLVPRELICIFNDHELELLISGLPDIDVADLRANTEYTGFSPNSPVIQWFWQVVADMDKQDLALLLQFVTGTSKVPLGGFRSLQGISGPQRFQIHKSYGATDRLPSAHTCFNQLDLPEYESKEQLAERLAMAIHEGHEGFGFG